MRRNSYVLAFVFLSFVMGVAALLSWQLGIAKGAPIRLEKSERVEAAQGTCGEPSEKFFYFYYYLGLVPVTSRLSVDQFSEAAARIFAEKSGQSLSNDLNTACSVGRLGDWGRFFLYVPNAWLRKTAQNPSMILATSAAFIVSLVGMLAAAFLHRRVLLGITIILLVGSYKIQLFWAYFINNIHGFLITTTLLLLAVNFRFVCQRNVPPLFRDWIIALVSGVTLACVRTARGDALPLIGGIVLVYLLSGQRLRRSVLLSVTAVSSLLIVSRSFDAYFEFKSRQSRAFITSVGGTIYASEPKLQHSFWHPFAAGLGDFGRDRGFLWEDGVIYKMALPQLNQKMGRNFSVEGYHFVEPSMRPEQYLKPETMKEYEEVLQEIVLTTIKNNPEWYLTILKKRIILLLTSMQKIRIGWSTGEILLPFSPWIILLAVLLSGFLKRFEHYKLLLFVLPTAFIPIVIFSGLGTVNFSIIHLMVAAIIVESLWLMSVAIVSRCRVSRVVDLSNAAARSGVMCREIDSTR